MTSQTGASSFRAALERLNPEPPPDAITTAVDELPRGRSATSLEATNREVHLRLKDGGFPKSREALKWLDDHLPNHRRVMAENPAWAIVPRSDRSPPNSAPNSAY